MQKIVWVNDSLKYLFLFRLKWRRLNVEVEASESLKTFYEKTLFTYQRHRRRRERADNKNAGLPS
jgi:hypothetical protein